MAETDFDRIKKQVRQFVVEREWDQFHSPKNLSMALIVEAAEMVEHFQWLTEEQSSNLSREQLAEVELELADIQIWFTVWSSIVHGGIMGLQAVADTHHIGHLAGDVAGLFAVAVVLGVLTPRRVTATRQR